MTGRILGVDPGEKRIGVSVSDPLGMTASPLQVVNHVSRMVDAAAVARLAAEQEAVLIVVGQPMDEAGTGESPEARRAVRFAETLRTQTDVPVILWDESMSTSDARDIRRAMGVSRRKRSGHLDDLAAAVILQSYLDAHYSPGTPSADFPEEGQSQ